MHQPLHSAVTRPPVVVRLVITDHRRKVANLESLMGHACLNLPLFQNHSFRPATWALPNKFGLPNKSAGCPISHLWRGVRHLRLKTSHPKPPTLAPRIAPNTIHAAMSSGSKLKIGGMNKPTPSNAPSIV